MGNETATLEKADQAVETVKKFDLQKMEFVEVPKVKEEVKKPDVDVDDPKDVEASKEEVKEEKKEEPAAEKKEEPSKEEKKEEKKEEERKEDEPSDEKPVEIDDFIKQQYGTDYEINSKKELDEILERVPDIFEENQKLKEKVKSLEEGSKKPVFESEAQEKLYEFLKPFDPDKYGEGMVTFAKIASMDLASTDPKSILEEKYIMDHPELSRNDAQLKFQRDYKRKYTVVDSEFDTPEEAAEEKKFREMDMKTDVARAKEALKAKQAEIKTKPKAESQVNETIQANIKENVAEVDSYIKEFKELIFEPENGEAFSYKFTKDQLKDISEGVRGWVGNPESYDAKGKVKGGFDIDKQTQQVAFFLFGPGIAEANFKRGLSMSEIKRAEDIAKNKPDRAKVAGDGKNVKGLTEEQQQERLIEQRKQKNSGKSVVYR